ncbi:hypothetical protein JOB18_044787 [Solea senegalensis]|uniref:Uncharacterized protein n=1 Tax=Solea senegalensis TaxID=28829 RepID=A0AAV6RE11_SOLSE|nr:hypothetical protein JOB18_044787 [Solea senegalensis]
MSHYWKAPGPDTVDGRVLNVFCSLGFPLRSRAILSTHTQGESVRGERVESDRDSVVGGAVHGAAKRKCWPWCFSEDKQLKKEVKPRLIQLSFHSVKPTNHQWRFVTCLLKPAALAASIPASKKPQCLAASRFASSCQAKGHKSV